MPVRLGDIELRSVQGVRADDNRTLVELRVPGQAGSVFQDLGRAPATVLLEGLLVGEGAAEALERLRAAYQKAEPLSFASDIAIGTEMTTIVIADLLVRQEAGYRERYRYTVKIREHVEPPENAAASRAAVDAAVAAEAAAWTDDTVAAADALADPGGLADALDERPGLLARMSADQLGESLGGKLDALDPHRLGDAVDKVAALDPAKAGGLLEKLKGMGKLGAFVEKLVAVGRTILAVGRKVGGILMNVGEIMDLINAAKAVGAAASKLWDDSREFWRRWSGGDVWRPPAAEPFIVPEPTPRAVTLRLGELVDALAKLVGLKILERVRDLAREYGLGGVVDAAARALIVAVEAVLKVVEVLRGIARAVAALWLAASVGAALREVVDATGELLEEAARREAEAVFRTLKWAAALLHAAPGPDDVDALGGALVRLVGEFRRFTLGGAAPPGVLPAATATAIGGRA